MKHRPTVQDLRKVVLEFIGDIEAAGGVYKVGPLYDPVGAPEWADLAATYFHACEAVGRKPKIVPRTHRLPHEME